MRLMDVVYQPCKGVVEGSWEWWLKGCFVWSSAATTETLVVAVGVGVVGALVAWALRRSA
jgi:hypothetical protein